MLASQDEATTIVVQGLQPEKNDGIQRLKMMDKANPVSKQTSASCGTRTHRAELQPLRTSAIGTAYPSLVQTWMPRGIAPKHEATWAVEGFRNNSKHDEQERYCRPFRRITTPTIARPGTKSLPLNRHGLGPRVWGFGFHVADKEEFGERSQRSSCQATAYQDDIT